MNNYLFTSESVSEGHPDKIADQISDGVLDAILEQDLNSRVACECIIKTGIIIIAGEITTNAWVDIEEIARGIIKEIGYNSSAMGFDWESCGIITSIGKQSRDIAIGVERGEYIRGAGDQGIMFGYACNETEELMPAPIMFAHKLVKRQAFVRKNKILEWLRPDAKSQVTLEYIDGVPKRVKAIVLSTQHEEGVKYNVLREAVIEEIIKPVFDTILLDEKTEFIVNPTGRFVTGGPLGDTGLTGRKIICDTYGGYSRHGGGCFSGKDPTKVDRSGAYIARHIAKNIVAAGLAKKCEIQLSYAIGLEKPISLYIDTFGTALLPNSDLIEIILRNFKLTPYEIIKYLDLLRPIYKSTSVYGHFGRNEDSFTWEKIISLY